MLYTPSKRCLCLEPCTNPPTHSYGRNHKMARNIADMQRGPAASQDAEGNPVPSHTALNLHGATLSIILDFSLYPSTFWTGEDFIPFRASLLRTLPLLLPEISRLLISVLFPHHRAQSNTLHLTQRDLVNRVAAIVRSYEGVEVEVLFQSPETEWCQVRCLAPFWGLKGYKWRVKVKDGERGARAIMGGSELGTKLQTEWRRMRDGRELY
jgi:hypothetical protein